MKTIIYIRTKQTKYIFLKVKKKIEVHHFRLNLLGHVSRMLHSQLVINNYLRKNCDLITYLLNTHTHPLLKKKSTINISRSNWDNSNIDKG